MQPNPWNRARDAWEQGDFPLTKVIIALNFLSLVLVTFRVPVVDHLVFIAPQSLREPWTLLTYPLVSGDIIWMLFYGLMLYSIGGSLERSWGTKFYAIYFASMSVICAIGVTAAAIILDQPAAPANWLPLATLAFTYYMLDPNQPVSVWGVLQTQAKWMALVDVLIIFFIHARMHPLVGFCALLGCVASYAWIRTRAWRDIHQYSSMPMRHTQVKKKKVRRDDDFSWRDLNPLERIARARRKKQFQRLFEDEDK
jgi:membrane associated rhomboid family serine protease